MSDSKALSEGAVYRRTEAGQRELIHMGSARQSMRGRILARVNGFTHLRGLMELSPHDADEIHVAICGLLADSFIEKVEV